MCQIEVRATLAALGIQGDDRDPWVIGGDRLHQTIQTILRPHLDKGAHARLEHASDNAFPVNALRQLSAQQHLRLPGILRVQFSRGVGINRDLRVLKRNGFECLGKRDLRRGDQGAVKRRTNG